MSKENNTLQRAPNGASPQSPASNEPPDKAVFQQRMEAWHPILHPVWVIVTFVLLGAAFVPTGFKCKQITDSVVQMVTAYDSFHSGTWEDLGCGISQANEGKTCTITFTPDTDMEPPVLIYYEINNFYQNHRSYMTSRDDNQLLGGTKQTPLAASLCDPLNQLGDIYLNPCGLIANTMFNDVITLESGTNEDGDDLDLVMLEDGIAWQSDLEYKFGQPKDLKTKRCDSCEDCEQEWDGDTLYEDAKTGVCWRFLYPNAESTRYLYETYPEIINPIEGVLSEHFIVWMRTAATPNFRKMYGWIDSKIPAGSTLQFKVKSNWEVKSFKGTKSLVLTTTSMFGGKNTNLGNSFIAVGTFCFIAALFFGLKHMIKPRKLGDRKYLKYKEE